ncbi:MAG: hypothetical protein LBC86_11185 [Oscillospiraceae bacterium]|jgi:DNA polymerase II small subunit/DNA polymerase delta subunit B|nr:hypothetical protein [Oscillospiraceae bacterium]
MIFDNVDFEKLKNVDVRTINPAELVDMSEIEINSDLPLDERLRDYIKKIKNPYCFRCGNTVVKISHGKTEDTIDDIMENFLLRI